MSRTDFIQDSMSLSRHYFLSRHQWNKTTETKPNELVGAWNRSSSFCVSPFLTRHLLKQTTEQNVLTGAWNRCIPFLYQFYPNSSLGLVTPGGSEERTAKNLYCVLTFYLEEAPTRRRHCFKVGNQKAHLLSAPVDRLTDRGFYEGRIAHRESDMGGERGGWGLVGRVGVEANSSSICARGGVLGQGLHDRRMFSSQTAKFVVRVVGDCHESGWFTRIMSSLGNEGLWALGWDYLYFTEFWGKNLGGCLNQSHPSTLTIRCSIIGVIKKVWIFKSQIQF